MHLILSSLTPIRGNLCRRSGFASGVQLLEGQHQHEEVWLRSGGDDRARRCRADGRQRRLAPSLASPLASSLAPPLAIRRSPRFAGGFLLLGRNLAEFSGSRFAPVRIPCYSRFRNPETAAMSWFLFVISLASIPLASEMACERGRSRRAWFWVAFLAGPLAPLALLLLGEPRRSIPAS